MTAARFAPGAGGGGEGGGGGGWGLSGGAGRGVSSGEGGVGRAGLGLGRMETVIVRSTVELRRRNLQAGSNTRQTSRG